ncbi:hypothetical protein QCA50_015426 [Cerrena zonata]|uniref:Transmembrane protein n=1 Tax=Cerrena zonata TaxID=2478898 RepID=A0AAW0FB43_9APHY
MIDWTSPTALAAQANAFLRMNHVLAGVYFWEFTTSLDFDWALISGKKRFNWPMIFYFLDRYCLFFALIGVLVALDTTTKINCQALYTFNQLAGNAAVGLASINLALRTMVIWGNSLYIVIPLVIGMLGHWSLILQGVLLDASWVDSVGCVITHTNNKILAATFIYSMCFDLSVLILSAVKILSRRGRSQLVTLLFKDGLVYFIIAFFSNFIATIFMCLNLNSIMSVIFNVPAAIASTIVACRAVRRLSNWSSTGVEVYSAPQASRTAAPTQSFSRSGATGFSARPKSENPGVHIEIETIADRSSDNTFRSQRINDTASDLESNLEHKSEAL